MKIKMTASLTDWFVLNVMTWQGGKKNPTCFPNITSERFSTTGCLILPLRCVLAQQPASSLSAESRKTQPRSKHHNVTAPLSVL